MPSTFSELRAYAESGQIPLDPTVRVKILEGYGKANALLEDYKKTHDAGMLKYRIAQLENSQRMLADNQRTAAALQETIGKNGRAAAAAAVERANALTRARTDIATKRAEFDSRTFNSAAAKYQAAAGDASGPPAAAMELFNSMTMQGVNYKLPSPNTASLADQYTTMIGAGSLSSIAADPAGVDAGVEKVVKKVGGGDALGSQLRQFLHVAIQGEAETKLASEALQKNEAELRRLAGLAYANPDAPPPKEVQDELLSLNERLSGDFLKYAHQSMPEVKAQLESAIAEDSEYQRLLGTADWYKSEYERMDPAMRKSKEVSLGRIVAQPIFQEWAKSNGLNIGTAVVNADGTVTYAPGGDDFKALMRFQYQMQHPDRFGERLFFDRGGSTGTVVEVTYTDPAERERQLARLAYDNGNLVGIESDGKMTYLTKQQYDDANNKSGAEPTGYQSAMDAEGNGYIKDPIGNVYKVDASGVPVPLVGSAPPAGLQFHDAIVMAGDKPSHYMTASDFDNHELLRPPAEGETKQADIGGAEQKDMDALSKVSPFRRVAPDQAREIGSFTTIGTLDKMHANTIIKNGAGAISINGGQQVITPDMKPYVREIVRKDGAKLGDVGGVVRQVVAEKYAREYGSGDPRTSAAEQRAIADAYYPTAPGTAPGIATAPLGTTATTAATTQAGSQIPQPSALLDSALQSPNPQARAEMLERQGNVTPGTSAAVAETLARAPAAPTTAPAAPSAAVTPAPAPAPVAAGAAAAAPAKPRITSNGYTYEIDVKPGQQATYTVIGGPGVDKMKDRVIEPGDKRYATFDANLRAEAEAAARSKTMTPISELPGARTLPAVRGAEVKPTTLPVTADTKAEVQLLGAPAPAAAPAPPKVEGRGEGVELEQRRGVLYEPTTRTRPTLASTIVGGLRGALREDAEGKEEPGFIEALKARREAKRQVETAGQTATVAPTTPSTSPVPLVPLRPGIREAGEAAVAKAQEEGFRRAALKEKYGPEAEEPLGLVKPRPGAGSITGLMTAALSQTSAPATTPAPAPTPTAASKPQPTPAAKPGAPIAPPSSPLLGGKSMAEQVAPQGIGTPTQEPAAPKGTPVQPTAAEASKLELAKRALKPPTQAPLGKKPEGAIPAAEPAAPSTAGAFKPGPQAKYERPSPTTTLRDAETAMAGPTRMTASGVGTNRGGPPPGPVRPTMTPPEAMADTLGPLGRYRAYSMSSGVKTEGEIPQAPAPTAPRAAAAPPAAKLDTSTAAQPSREAQIREARLREIEARRREMQDALAAAKQNPARATVPALNAPAAIRR